MQHRYAATSGAQQANEGVGAKEIQAKDTRIYHGIFHENKLGLLLSRQISSSLLQKKKFRTKKEWELSSSE